MSDTVRMTLAAIPALIWLSVVAANIFYLWGHLRDRTLDGPSPLPIVGSLCGLIALVVMPWGTISMRFLLLPAALLPDLMTVAAYRWIDWMNRHGG